MTVAEFLIGQAKFLRKRAANPEERAQIDWYIARIAALEQEAPKASGNGANGGQGPETTEGESSD